MGYVIIFCAFVLIIGGIMLIRKSANKFVLSDEQKEKVKQRQLEQLEQLEKDKQLK